VGSACEQPSGGGGSPLPAPTVHTLTSDSDDVVIKISDTNTQPSVRATEPANGNWYWVFLNNVLINTGKITVNKTEKSITFSTGNFKLTLQDDGSFILSGNIPNSQPGGNPITSGKTFTGGDTSTAKVYVAGAYGNPHDTAQLACYWKNGVKVNLPPGTVSGINAIAVSGGKVYTAGWWDDDGNLNTKKALYWIDGTRANLHTEDMGISSEANGIAVSGDSVYVAGCYHSEVITSPKACYWLNGTRTDLHTGMSFAGGIAVSGGNVYVAGWYANSGDKPCYWKKEGDTITINELPVPVTRGRASAIAVSGSNIYIAGYYETNDGTEIACYWKKEGDNPISRTNLHTGRSGTYGIAVSGGNVYVAGYYRENDTEKACYWLDGNRTDLHTGASLSRATGITVSGNNVYVAGTYSNESSNTLTAWWWRNGTRTNLSGTNNYAAAIVVTE
jgi:hypothetical protein